MMVIEEEINGIRPKKTSRDRRQARRSLIGCTEGREWQLPMNQPNTTAVSGQGRERRSRREKIEKIAGLLSSVLYSKFATIKSHRKRMER